MSDEKFNAYVERTYGGMFRLEDHPFKTDIKLAYNAGGTDRFREGMVAAAGIAENASVAAEEIGKQHPEDSDSRDRMFARAREAHDLYRDILAAASEPAKVPEVCEWRQYGGGYRPACLHGVYTLIEETCPCCGKTVSVREG